MIQCTHCGTKNRDGSKFCGDCGARLVQQSGLICPMCSTPNTVENVFCSKCGARLVPLTVAPPSEKTPPPTPIKGLSLPSKPSEPTVPAPKTEEARAPQPPPAPKTEEARAPEPPPAQKVEPRAESSPPDDWLSRLRDLAAEEAPVEAESAEPEAESAEETSGDWLARLRASAPEEEASPSALARRAAEVTPIAEEDLPDWLRAGTDAVASSTPTAGEEESPGQLTRAEEPAPADALPDWLKDTGAPVVAAEETAPPREQLDWFKPVEAAPEVPPPTQATDEELPAWLRALKPEEPTAASEAISSETPGEAMLESLEAAAAEGALEKPTWLTETLPVEAGEEEFLPDWLRTPPPPAETRAEPLPEVAPEFAGEVPDWIAALKPQEQPVPGMVTSGALETTGALAGLRGVLPLATAVTEPHILPPAPPAHPFQEQARLFESILGAPALAPVAPKPTRRAWTMRPLIYLLLLAAVLLPFFLPDLAGTSLRTFGTPAADFYDTIQALRPDALVVVSFDYEPGSAGEMDLQANVLLRHLMQRRARILAISTLDTGAPVAQRVLEDAARAVGNVTYGVNYLNLGYVPGYEAGLRQLATAGFAPTLRDFSNRQTLDRYAAFSPAQSWRNVALVIELTGSPEALQRWMEQVQPRAGVKIAAGVSAAVEPRARAYRDAKQLTGLLGGLVGAAQYEILTNQRGLAVISLGAQSTANLVLLVLIVLGNVYWLLRERGKAK